MYSILIALAAMPLVGDQCSNVAAAHREWLQASLSIERHMQVEINGELRGRTVDRLERTGGRLRVSELSRQTYGEPIDLDTNGDRVFDLPFACERAQMDGEGRITLRSEDGRESAVFDMRGQKLELREWQREQPIRMLWKKLIVRMTATYESTLGGSVSTRPRSQIDG